MSDPLSLVPLAAAAGGGRMDGHDVGRLVAAGLTLLQRSAPLVRALQGRRAAILLPTSSTFLTALAASEGRGAVLVNPLAAPPEVAYQLADADVGAVLTTAALAAKLPPDVPRVLLDDAPRSAQVIVDGVVREVDLGSHVGLSLEGSADASGSPEEVAIVYTSAMAGRALGARLTHANLLSNARATIEAASIGPDDHALAMLPFSHLFGLVVSGLTPLLVGGRVTTVERFHPLRGAEFLETSDVTLLVGVPAVFGALLSAIERRGGLRNRTLRACICGGAPLPVALQDRWFEVTGVELRQGYGLTEAGPVCLFNRIGLPNHRGTLGHPFPGVEVEIHDPSNGHALPRDVEGEICVRGPNVFAGYVSGGEHGLHVRDGWLHTGDLGVLDHHGTIRFRGLLKPMFTRNGFNIYPAEIARVVRQLPGVRTVRVRAVPDAAKENGIALDVDGDVTADDVRAWCAAQLSAYKQPTEIDVGG